MERTDNDSQSNLRDALRRVVVAWLFGAAWMYLVSGASFTRYAKLLHVSNFGFGILASIPFVGALIQLPASFLLERYGRRKETFLWCSSLHRVLWLVIAALPWLLPDRWQWPGLLVLMLASTILANISTPAWMSWMAELIPGRIRGRYFSRRVQYGQAVGLILSFLSGLALDWPDPEQQLLLRNVISALFAVAGVCGIIDILFFLKVPDTAKATHRPTLSFSDLVRAPLADRNFRRFLGYSFTMTFATGFVGQFVWLYLFDVVGMSNVRANLMLVSVPLLIGMATYPFWGRIVDRFGSKPALIGAGLLIINGATFWIFITPGSWIPGYILVLTSTAAWAGMDIASFNLLLRMTEIKGSGKRSSDSAVIAINSVVAAIAGTLSGLFGGSVAEWLGSDWRTMIFGWPLTYHGVLFLCSGVLRMAAVAWIFTLKEPQGKVATREALRYMAADAYSNLLQATFFPARMFVRMARATWKISVRSVRALPKLPRD
jgi:MFS family permease